MKLFISPAKRMRVDADFILPPTVPVYLKQAEQLSAYCKSLSYEQLKRLFACNDAIAEQNFIRYQEMDLSRGLSPAIFAYDGIQYQYMAPQVFETAYFDYIQENLRILSGLYGILKPFDGVCSYRLEMQAKLKAPFAANLYGFWGDMLYRELVKDGDVLINLASAEYAKCITRYLQPSDRMITCVFAEQVGEKLIEKGVYVKMARGEMVRYLAECGATEPEQLKGFDRLNYRFSEKHSDEASYVFIR